MSFLFGGRKGKNDQSDTSKEQEEVKTLKAKLNNLINENHRLKERIDDQKETTTQNQKLLEDYIFSLTTQEEVVEKMNFNIHTLQNKASSQAQMIKQLKYVCLRSVGKRRKGWSGISRQMIRKIRRIQSFVKLVEDLLQKLSKGMNCY
jgi:DNA repair exonuclease SbcCD ATPase subunit